jgi:hypothetical protein
MAKSVEKKDVKAKDKKSEKVARVAYPGIQVGPDGKGTVKLKEWPADFDHRKHQPLARSDFENEAPWLIARAERLEKMAAKCRKDADLATKFGNKEQRQMAKKLQHMNEKVAEMMKDLQAQGLDPAMFLSNMVAPK